MQTQMIQAILAGLGEKKLLRSSPFGGWEYRLADYGNDCAYTYVTDWAPLDENTPLPCDKTVFARVSVTFPEEILCGESGVRDYLFLRLSGMEGYITVDGEIYQGHDGNRDRFPLRKEWAGQTKTVEIMGFTRSQSRHFFEYSFFGRVALAVEDFEFSLSLARSFFDLDAAEEENATRILRARVETAVDSALRDFDGDAEGQALREQCIHASVALSDALSLIDDGDVHGQVSFIGHTHIDVAWLWQLKDTVRKCAHTFSNVLRLMDEYPDFRFACSQMQLLSYTKEHFPALFEQIKARIAEGRFELVGTMWVESDCNMISGESLVRQILYGTAFSEKEFGKRNHIAWLPDTFGFQPNMPQILKKTGTEYFYSNKIHWQGQNRFPYTSFRWKGLDGSEVLASIPRTSDFYNGSPEPAQMRFAERMNLQAGREDEIILPVGHGDGGGGPTREMLRRAALLKDFPGLPKSKTENAADFFARLDARRESLPVWYGDLYIETHRGCLSTLGECKKNNRRAELLYQAAEKLGVAAQNAGLSPAWEKLAEGWKEILLLQFHDILPGSSVDPVYDEDCKNGYEKVFRLAREFLSDIYPGICQTGKGFFVYNALSFTRSGIVEIPCADETLTAVTDDKGNLLPSQVYYEEGRRFIRFLAKDVPGLTGMTFAPMYMEEPQGGMKIYSALGRITVENDRFLYCFDASGSLSRLYDRINDREVISGAAGEIRIFRDGPQREDAWNLYEDYREREIRNYPFRRAIHVEENTALRTVLVRTMTAEKCEITQRITLYPHTDRIDFITHVKWNESHKILRAYVPCAVSAPFVALEEGFGTYLRPTTASTPFERSRFEFCAHRFADLSDGAYGVSLLNDCKYGHSVEGSTLGITLLRSTTHPAAHADMGEHDFTYSIYPHTGDWRTGNTVREGLDLNLPLLARKGVGSLSAPAVCEDANIIIDTVKAAEDGRGVIVRLYECNGCSGKTTLRFPKEKTVVECDLLEKPLSESAITAALPLCYTPYQIRTYRIY